MKEQNLNIGEVLELVNGGIDGELTREQQNQLDKLLANSAEAREIDKELRAVIDSLDELPEVDPPGYLQNVILNRASSLFTGQQKTGKTRKPGLPWFANWLRTGVAVAAVAVLTVGIYQVGSSPVDPRDASSMVGTVVDNPGLAAGVLLDRVDLDNSAISGLIEFRKKDDLFILDVKLDSGIPTRSKIDFSGTGLKLHDIAQVQSSSESVAVDGETIKISSQQGQQYQLTLEQYPQRQIVGKESLAVKIFSKETLVREAKLTIPD